MAIKAVEMEVEESCGNVFEDLGLPEAAELQTKLRLIVFINRTIDQRGLNQTEAAALLGIKQPKVSALLHYRLGGFSVERLMKMVTALEYDVVIQIRPRTEESGAARIMVQDAA